MARGYRVLGRMVLDLEGCLHPGSRAGRPDDPAGALLLGNLVSCSA